jgi:hypothetical protein
MLPSQKLVGPRAFLLEMLRAEQHAFMPLDAVGRKGRVHASIGFFT